MPEAQQPNAGNLADSIAMLEQILEVMPQDAVALKALYSAYRKNGETEKAFGHLGRLVGVTIGGADMELLAYVRNELAVKGVSPPNSCFPESIPLPANSLRNLLRSERSKTETNQRLNQYNELGGLTPFLTPFLGRTQIRIGSGMRLSQR